MLKLLPPSSLYACTHIERCQFVYTFASIRTFSSLVKCFLDFSVLLILAPPFAATFSDVRRSKRILLKCHTHRHRWCFSGFDWWREHYIHRYINICFDSIARQDYSGEIRQIQMHILVACICVYIWKSESDYHTRCILYKVIWYGFNRYFCVCRRFPACSLPSEIIIITHNASIRRFGDKQTSDATAVNSNCDETTAYILTEIICLFYENERQTKRFGTKSHIPIHIHTSVGDYVSWIRIVYFFEYLLFSFESIARNV